MHHATVSFSDVAGAVLLLAFAVAMWLAVAVLAYATRRNVKPWCLYGAVGVVAAGLLGQLGHVQEHIAQAGYWVLHPQQQPWMTPWGDALARGFGIVDPAKHPLGMEILHLVGNFIFLAAFVGVCLVTRFAVTSQARKWGRMGVWMQGFHGLEHLALTVSVALGHRAIGFSTWFGALPDGAGLWTYRVWWHFVFNVVGTCVLAYAVLLLWRERKLVADSWSTVLRAPLSVPRAREAGDDHVGSPVHLKAGTRR